MEKLKEHKHQIIYAMLVVIILLLLSRGKQGRYAVSALESSVFVLDTKTSQLWLRQPKANAYLGTNENPKFEITAVQGNQKIVEELFSE